MRIESLRSLQVRQTAGDRLRVAGLIAAVAATALSGSLLAANSGPNLLANGAFAAEAAPWYSLAEQGNRHWRPFRLDADPLEPANRAARLDLSSDPADRKTGIWGVIQDLPDVRYIPEHLGGRYYVSHWNRGTAKQYLQAVVIAWTRRDYFGRGPAPGGKQVPVQMAFVLAGLDRPPFKITNRRFVFQGPVEPEVGRWIDFSINLQEEFLARWGFLPEELEGLRVLFEVRFDELAPTETAARATVFFDDLYLGPPGP